MKKYEAVFILDPRKVDDEGKAFAGQFEQLINGWGGTMIENVAMGRKTFAREIKKRKAGYYFDFVFEVEQAKEGRSATSSAWTTVSCGSSPSSTIVRNTSAPSSRFRKRRPFPRFPRRRQSKRLY